MISLLSIRRSSRMAICSPPLHKIKKMTKRNSFRRRLEAFHLSVMQVSPNPLSTRLIPPKSGQRTSNMLSKPTTQPFRHTSILHRSESRHHISKINNQISIFSWNNNKVYNNKCKRKIKLYLSKAPTFCFTSATKEQTNCPK